MPSQKDIEGGTGPWLVLNAIPALRWLWKKIVPKLKRPRRKETRK